MSAIGDLDDRTARFEPGPSLGRAIFFEIFGVQFLDIEVDIVQMGRGETPGDVLVATQKDDRHTGDGAADHRTRGKLEPREVPDSGRGQIEMRIVGQK